MLKQLVRRPFYKLALGALVAVLIYSGFSPNLVAADFCTGDGPGNNYGAIGDTHGYNNYGGQGTAPEKDYVVYDWAPPANGFVIHRLLVRVGPASPGPYWGEIGYGWGFKGENVEHFYYARQTPSLPYDEFKMDKVPAPGEGTLHGYKIHVDPYLGGGSVTAYIDGEQWAFTGGFTDNWSSYMEFGGEATSANSSMGDTPATQLKYRTSGGSWLDWSNDISQTECHSDDPYSWAWTVFPASGHFWK